MTDVVTIPYTIYDGSAPQYKLEAFSLSGIYAKRFVIPAYAITIGTGEFNKIKYDGRGIIEYSYIGIVQLGSDPYVDAYPHYELGTHNAIDDNALFEVNSAQITIYCTQEFKNEHTNNSVLDSFGYNKNGKITYIIPTPPGE
jgi:hypothetical protein